MNFGLVKSLVLWGISRGMRLPEAPLERINELTRLKRLLQRLQVDCVVDVGANRGQFAGELRTIGFKGLIFSFEPISTEFDAVSVRFRSDAKWKGYRLALGSVEESKAITIPRLTVMSSLLEPLTREEDCRTEIIQVRRLDTLLPGLLAEYGVSRAFLKMDTQGYDLEVFRGAAGCLEMIEGIQSELSVQPLYRNMPHYIEVLAEYEAAGFALFHLSVVNRTAAEGLLELNCFMARGG
jgi:FkbM family methyltransferase